MKEKLHTGRTPCFTFKNGEVKLHETIARAGEELGVKTHSGSWIRQTLNKNGVYRGPKTMGAPIAWFPGQPVPEEAKEAYDVGRGVLW